MNTKTLWIIAAVLCLSLSLIGCKKGESPPEKTPEKKTPAKADPKAEKKRQIPGFQYLGEKTYTCGGVTNTVKEYRHVKTGMEFVLVPGGVYRLGGKSVRLSAYLMGKYEVTQKVWRQVMGTRPWSGKQYVRSGDQYPAVYVSWNDAQAFCRKLGLFLPSEAQWEAACRAGTTTKYYWGDSMDGAYVWYRDNAWNKGNKYAHQVGRKKPNAFGLYDMSGNVWEWCRDWYGRSYPSGMVNPTGPSTGSDRVSRGGSFSGYAGDCASGIRGLSSPGSRGHLGFRVVFPVK